MEGRPLPEAAKSWGFLSLLEVVIGSLVGMDDLVLTT